MILLSRVFGGSVEISKNNVVGSDADCLSPTIIW